MDEEIVNTLGELERKLHELERVLSTMDREEEPLREPEAQREAPPQPVEASQRIEGPQGLKPAPAPQAAAAGPDARASRLVEGGVRAAHTLERNHLLIRWNESYCSWLLRATGLCSDFRWLRK